MNTFGKNLKRERENCKLSQQDFADKIGTTQQLVSMWETGKSEPSLFYLTAITKILDVSFEDLIADAK